MYLLIPVIFLVPIHYAVEDILDIKKSIILQKRNYDINCTNKVVNKNQLVIGLSLPTQRDERWIRDKEAMEAYARDKGVILKIENADFDAAKQASQVENLISQDIDVLILVPVDLSTAANIVEKSHKAGIKVISYDGLVKNSDVDMYVAFNNIRIGELQGRFLTEKVPRGNYIIMSGDTGAMFKEGAMEYIQPLVSVRNIKIVADKVLRDWDPNIAFNVVKDALINNQNKIDAILAPNDATAGAAIEALKEQDLPGKVAITGLDADLAAIRRIIQGTQSMTVFKDSRELGKTAIDTAISLATGKAVEINSTVNNGKMDVPSILLTPIAIDKNNIDNILIDSGYYNKEDVYKRHTI